MLKRYQVLLEDWMVSYLGYISKTYDVSFSEVVRVAVCLEFISMVSSIYPKHKFGVDRKKIVKTLEGIRHGRKTGEEFHELISKVYFEARKAVEFRLNHARKIEK